MSHSGFSPRDRRLRNISPFHFLFHKIYSMMETSFILQLVDWLLSRKAMNTTRWGKKVMLLIAKASRDLPHGIIVTTEAAGRAVDFLDRLEGPDNVRFALGPCLCQLAMHKWEEPVIKDIQMLYAKDMFMSLKLGYRVVGAAEVKALLKRCHDLGYVHALEMCRQSGRWLFCICNCEPRICAPMRVYLLVGEMMWQGPEICVSDLKRCKGVEKCGRCVERCVFSAIEVRGGKAGVDREKCMGCGLCVSTCPKDARSMVVREDYAHGHQVPAEILLQGHA